jgi:phage terminase large subunit-like protein
MCRLDLIYTAAELRALNRKKRAALTKQGLRLVRTSPQIRNIIKKDPKVRRKLKTLLRPTFSRLKRK